MFGDRFVRCRAQEGGMLVTFSNARTGEKLGPGSASARLGLEHFAIDTQDIDADIARLKALGAELQEGPLQVPNGARFAFLTVPHDVRLELVEPPKARLERVDVYRLNQIMAPTRDSMDANDSAVFS